MEESTTMDGLFPEQLEGPARFDGIIMVEQQATINGIQDLVFQVLLIMDGVIIMEEMDGLFKEDQEGQAITQDLGSLSRVE